MAREDAVRKYAPIWAILLGAVAALAKKTSTRYLVERSWSLKPSDIAVALLIAGFSYLSFRFRFGYGDRESWYKR